MRLCTVLALVIFSSFGSAATPAGAQVDEDRPVEVTFDVGEFDAARGDWPITVVYVTGDIDEGREFTVAMWDEDDVMLWSETDVFDAPTTAVAVDSFVAVGDVTEAGLMQELPEPAQPAGPLVEGEQAALPAATPTTVVPDEDDPPPTTTTTLPDPAVADEVTERRPRAQEVQVLESGAGPGGAGSGQLALSMVVAIVLVSIVFRAPLPSATTQRWRK